MIRRGLVLDEFARFDIDEASEWYEQISLSLRERFTRTLNSIFRIIQEYPLAFQIVHKDVHRVLLKDFPYMVLYRVFPDEIIVYGVIHTSRNPTTWIERNFPTPQ